MKTYAMLTSEQQNKAQEAALVSLMKASIENPVELWDAHTARKIVKACEKATSLQTPWFAHEYVMDTCAKIFKQAALLDAQAAMYVEHGDPRMVGGIAE